MNMGGNLSKINYKHILNVMTRFKGQPFKDIICKLDINIDIGYDDQNDINFDLLVDYVVNAMFMWFDKDYKADMLRVKPMKIDNDRLDKYILSNIDFSKPAFDNFEEEYKKWFSKPIMLVVYEEKENFLNNIFINVFLLSPSPEDIAIFKSDYANIVDTIKDGKAHELNESSTFYLGACNNRITNGSEYETQFYGNHIPTRKKQLCLKESYISSYYSELIGENEYTPKIQNSEIDFEHFEESVLNRIKKFIGKTDAKLCEIFGVKNDNSKSQWYDLTVKILGNSQFNELRKSNVSIRALRIDENNKIKESISLSTFKFKELINESWEESDIYNYFSTNRFLFVVYKMIDNNYVLAGAKLWNMPFHDLNNIVRKEWQDIKGIISDGVKFEVEKTEKGFVVRNNLPSKANTKIIHIRPKAQQAAYKLNNGYTIGNIERDANELPNGEYMTNQCFWLNNSYIMEQIDIDSFVVEPKNEELENKDIIFKNKIGIWKLSDYGLSIKQNYLLYEAGYTLEKIKNEDYFFFKTIFGSKPSLYDNVKRLTEQIDNYEDYCVPFSALYIYGVSERYINIIKQRQISFNKLCGFSLKDLMNFFNTGEKKALDIKNAIDNLANDFNPSFKITTINDSTSNGMLEYYDNSLKVLDVLQKYPDGCGIMLLSTLTGLKLDEVQNIVTTMAKESRIEYCSLGVKLHKLTLMEYAEKIEIDTKREIFKARLFGKTLEEIGIENNITRERARQIFSKLLKETPSVKEDRYKRIYEKYDFSKEEFIDYLECEDYEYNYLKLKYKKGNIIPSLDELVTENVITDEKKNEILSRSTIIDNGVRIDKDRRAIFSYVAKNIDGYFKPEELLFTYQEFLISHGIDDEKLINVDERYITGRAPELNIINSYRLGFRYFEIDEDFFNELIAKIDLKAYKNTVITTKIFFSAYQEFLNEQDIRNEYELHNILKIGFSKYGYNDLDITFLRMPLLQFGEIDKYSLVSDNIYQLSPVSVNEFIGYMSAEYGFKENSLLAYTQAEFSQFIHDGYLKIDVEVPTEEEIETMKNILTKEFYFVDEYKEIVETYGFDNKYLSKLYVDCFGYTLFANYLLSKKWNYAYEYFDYILYENDIFDFNKVNPRMKELSLFTERLHLAIDSMDLFQFDRTGFISIKRLKETDGITKEFLIDYVDEILDLVSDEEFFTINYLINKGLKEVIYSIGFNDLFYISLFRHSKKVKNCSFNNNIIFKKTDSVFTKTDFVEEIVYANGAMTVYDMLDYLENKYSIKCSFEEIATEMKKSRLYYNEVLEKAFIDYEQFLEEIENEFA